jgi:probable phosphoglycerate mutase
VSERSESTRLIVWRHGNTDWNRGGRVQGQTDTPLNEAGRAQAARAATVLAALRPDAIVSSDLSRAADTAAALAALTGLPVSIDERLRERAYGRWQGLTMAEIPNLFPAEYTRWRAGDQAPGCDIESLDDLGKRVGEALREAAEGTPGGTVVVATHGGGSKQGIAWLLGWPPESTRMLTGMDNCHWSVLRHDPRGSFGGWRLAAYNAGPPPTATA